MRPELEAERESLENILAGLAGANVRLELVALRISHATKYSGMNALLDPAADDTREVMHTIEKVKEALGRIWKDYWSV